MAKIEIRKATLKDIPEIIRLWKDSRDYHRRLNDDFKFKKNAAITYEKYVRKSTRIRNSAVFVAQASETRSEGIGGAKSEHQQLAGYVLVTIQELPPVYVFEKEGFVSDLFVNEEWRGKQVGRRLLKKAEEWCRRKKLYNMSLTVNWKNARARKFYGKFGLKELLVKMYVITSNK